MATSHIGTRGAQGRIQFGEGTELFGSARAWLDRLDPSITMVACHGGTSWTDYRRDLDGVVSDFMLMHGRVQLFASCKSASFEIIARALYVAEQTLRPTWGLELSFADTMKSKRTAIMRLFFPDGTFVDATAAEFLFRGGGSGAGTLIQGYEGGAIPLPVDYY